MLRRNQHPDQSSSPQARTTARGQVMIIFALATVVLVGMLALSVDVGFLMAERRQVQSAADSAALAAAQSALDNDLAGMTAAAESYAIENAGNGATVTVNPNAAGPGTAERYVEVTVTIDVQRFFLGAVYQGDWSTTATAMAAVEDSDGNYALITLDENAIPGIYMNGTTGIIISGNEGGAASNSTIQGLPNTTFNVDGVIHAFGSIQQGSNWNAQRIVQNRNRLVPDPILEAELDAPEPPDQVRDQAYVDSCLSSNPCTLQPGRYTDVEIDMENNDRIVMSPGLYYFDGNSSFDLKNNSEVTGNGVLLYFTGSASLQPKNGNINLSATNPAGTNDVPTHGDVVIWVANCTDVDLQGNGDMYFEGIFYAPCSHSWMHGGTTETIRGQLILGSLDVRGNTALRIVYEQRASTSQPAVFLVR